MYALDQKEQNRSLFASLSFFFLSRRRASEHSAPTITTMYD